MAKSKKEKLKESDTYTGLSDDKTVELNGRMVSPKEWLNIFNSEYYYGQRYKKMEILKDKEHKAEAERMNNSNKRDALNLTDRGASFDKLNKSEEQFMEEASDEWEWQNCFKMNGFEASVVLIYAQTERDLQNKFIDVNVTLSRFLIKMNKLRTLKRRESRND